MNLEKADNLTPKKTVAEVLDHVASDDEQLADFLRRETMRRIDKVSERAAEEFEDQYFWVKDADGDAIVEVTGMAPTGQPEIIEIDDEEATLQLDFEVSYTAHLSYLDSGSSIYSEGDLVYAEHRRETVRRTKPVSVIIEVQFSTRIPTNSRW